MIEEHFNEIKRIIDSYAAAPFVLDTQVSFELHPGNQGYVVGIVLFQDRSILYFREYLDSDAGFVSKLMYSYHYQDAEQHLVFRYDNARHRPAPPTPEHKTCWGKRCCQQSPTLTEVLIEIALTRGWV